MFKINFPLVKPLLPSVISKISPIAFSLFLLFNQVFSQPVNAYFDPPEFEEEDEIDLIIEYGTSDNPVQNAMTAHFEIAYDGFEIDEESHLSVDASSPSWFGSDGLYNGRIVVDHDLHLIIVDLERIESAASGYGYVAKGSGITIAISEINAKKSPALSVKKAEYTFPTQHSLNFDATTKMLNINVPAISFKQLDILDISGRRVYSSQQSMNQLPMNQFPANIYFVRFHSALGVENLKLMVSP